jgi:hypothetical protein
MAHSSEGLCRLITLQFKLIRIRSNYAKRRDEQLIEQSRNLNNEITFRIDKMTSLVHHNARLWQVFGLSLYTDRLIKRNVLSARNQTVIDLDLKLASENLSIILLTS